MIAIIDYGYSNLLSIRRAVEQYEKECIVTNDPTDLCDADKIILPGVGSFISGMTKLNELGFSVAIREQSEKGKPILGICLGMQMLLDESEEGGAFGGLGLIHGKVTRIPNYDIMSCRQDVPHVGWEQLYPTDSGFKNCEFFKYPNRVGEVYFVHSYEAVVDDAENIMATVLYGGRDIVAVIQNKKTIGCQFHPEKSGKCGLEMIEKFVNDF